jgi:hypothetical protein
MRKLEIADAPVDEPEPLFDLEAANCTWRPRGVADPAEQGITRWLDCTC